MSVQSSDGVSGGSQTLESSQLEMHILFDRCLISEVIHGVKELLYNAELPM